MITWLLCFLSNGKVLSASFTHVCRQGPAAHTSPDVPLPQERLCQLVGARPWWRAFVAGNRDLWQRTAISEDLVGSTRAFWLLFAKQMPFEATFMEIRQRPFEWPELPAAGHDGQVLPDSRREWELLQPMRIIKDTDIGFDEDASLLVCACLRFEGCRIISPHDPRPFEDFVRLHPRRVAPRHDKAPNSRRLPLSVEDLLLEACL